MRKGGSERLLQAPPLEAPATDTLGNTCSPRCCVGLSGGQEECHRAAADQADRPSAPHGLPTQGRGSVLLAEGREEEKKEGGRREGTLSSARGTERPSRVFLTGLNRLIGRAARELAPQAALLWPSEVDDTRGLSSAFRTTTGREEPRERASMCGGGGWRETDS